VIDLQQQWLNAVPWDSVLTVNKALCQAQKLEPMTNAKGLDAVRQLWGAAAARIMSLKEVLEFCRQCHELGPFAYNNGNTFAAVGRTLIEDLLKPLTPVEAQILRTTVGHYIVGLVGRRELLQVLAHFKSRPVPQTAPAATPPAQPLPAPLLTPARPQA
jgi:hypothetical protein